MNSKPPVPIPPAIAKYGIKRVTTNLLPGEEVRINAKAFVAIFSDELIDLMRKRQKPQK